MHHFNELLYLKIKSKLCFDEFHKNFYKKYEIVLVILKFPKYIKN